MDWARGENGEYLIKRPGTPWEEVSEERYSALSKTRGENIAGSFGDTLQDSLGGATEFASGAQGGSGVLGAVGNAANAVFNPVGAVMDMAGVNPMADAGRSIQAQNDPRQAERSRADSFGSAVGTGLGVAAELAIPSGPVGKAAGVGRMIRTPTTVVPSMVETAQSVIANSGNTVAAVGRTVGRSIESVPVIGPVVRDAAEAGGRAVARGVEGRRARNLSAAANENPGRWRDKLMSSDELAEYGGDIELHPAITAKLNATDEAMHADAGNMIGELENAEAARGGGELTDSLDNLQAHLNTNFKHRIGMDQSIHPDKGALGDRLTELNGELKGLRKSVTEPVDLDGVVDEIKADLSEVYNVDASAQRVLDKVLDDIGAFTEDSGLISAEKYGVIENRLTRAMDEAAKSTDINTLEILSDVRARLSARLEEVMDPETRAAIQEKKKQFVYTKAAVKSASAVGERGVNPRTMYTALTKGENMAQTGRSRDPFIKYLDTVKSVLSEKKPQTGARNQQLIQQLIQQK